MPGDAKGITKRIGVLRTKLAADLAAKTITQADADSLKARIDALETAIDTEPNVTDDYRKEKRAETSKIEKDLAALDGSKASKSDPAAAVDTGTGNTTNYFGN